MLIELGPRTIGRCELQLDGCTAKAINIVKKILSARDIGTRWSCQKCLMKKNQTDRMEYKKRRQHKVV